MKVVELASFELANEISQEEFLEVSTLFQTDFVANQAGFIERKLIKSGEIWSDLVVWQNMDCAEAVSNQMGSSEFARKYGSMIKAGSVTVKHYEVFQDAVL